ncbi:acyltransferase [Calothrix sp. 336/3]|uniref:acyltransferase n=1 Tax=Calothrix sp. 336/3 TaxID=1337936 RepID=UPI0004E3C3FE|nr:acyltransferase [Calothrix sp. 336/3]AKG20770.1 transferase [Calothrix sp. 336/3]
MRHQTTILHKIKRLTEVLLTNLLGEIPAIFMGTIIRNIAYKFIFPQVGKIVYIQNGVEFLGCRCIRLGNYVRVHRGTHINATGHQDNLIDFADGVQLQQGVNIKALNNTRIFIDEDTYLGSYVCLAGPGNITIGKYCLIAANSGIFANNHIFTDPTKTIDSQGVTRAGIVIEDDCWLGHGVTVLDGVTIGKGSVIGAGSVVTKNIPPYSVAVGVPARVIRSRNSNEVVKLDINSVASESQYF